MGRIPDLEVHQIIGSQVLVRASEKAARSPRGSPGGARATARGGVGRLRSTPGRSYLPRIRSLEIGSSAYFYLVDEGVYGRISLQTDGQGRVFLLRSLNLERGALAAPRAQPWRLGKDRQGWGAAEL